MAQRQEKVASRGTGPVVEAIHPLKLWLGRCIAAVWCLWLLVLTLVAVSRFFANQAWAIDLVANVSYFIALPAALTVVAALWRRRLGYAGCALLVTLTAFWPVRWMIRPASTPPTAPASRHEVRVVVANVHGSQQALDGLIALLGRVQPDVAVAIEVSPGLESYLSENPVVREALPFVVGPERGMTWRDMILTRHPMHRLRFDGDDERYKFVYAYRRSCFVDKPEGRFLFTAAHPASPRNVSVWAHGNEITSLLAEVIQAHLLPVGVPVVVGGDFNATPSGRRHRIMLDRSGLRPVDEIGGITGTWPSDWPGPLRLTIDRVWASPNVEFIRREVLEDIGSDHRPILVTLSLPRGEEP